MIFKLILRNLRIYFRDKASVFFSLLGVFVIIGLYILFLRDAVIGNLDQTFPEVAFVMDSWIMSGVVAAASITTTMGAFGTMVDDTTKKNIKDFQVSPIKRWQIVLGYVMSSVVIGVIMSLLTLVLAEIYIVAQGGYLLSVLALLKTIGLIVLSVVTSSAMIFFFVSFFKSQNAFATASTLIGTLIGFFMGVYFPIGQLPDGVGYAIKIFPLSHSGVLLRQVMMDEAMEKAFTGVDPSVFNVDSFNERMGIVFKYGNVTFPIWAHLVVLIVTAAIFFLFTVLRMSSHKAKE
ncbi:MAG: ABC transporter permease [Candidatus Izemoplasmatales bacterium]|jgi:multidrug/hemolysin transport system permease protein|nr:ABC transporter permease [Candidatus Izemoplasmatales bacterium]MDD3865842.1 ABC transporter permease [Candidatus Izemoplasmatales bacterium]